MQLEGKLIDSSRKVCKILEQVENIETSLANKLESILNPTTGKGLPWN